MENNCVLDDFIHDTENDSLKIKDMKYFVETPDIHTLRAHGKQIDIAGSNSPIFLYKGHIYKATYKFMCAKYEYLIMNKAYDIISHDISHNIMSHDIMKYDIGCVKPIAYYTRKLWRTICMEYIPDTIQWSSNDPSILWNEQDMSCDMSTHRFTTIECIDIFIQVTRIVEILHNNGIVHSDLKSQNILIANNKVYIIDFGLSYSIKDEDEYTELITYTLTTPEHIKYIECSKGLSENLQNQLILSMLSFNTDIWAVGVSMYEMLYNSYPFIDYGKIIVCDYYIPQNVHTQEYDIIKDIIESIFTPINTRINISDLKQKLIAYYSKLLL